MLESEAEDRNIQKKERANREAAVHREGSLPAARAGHYHHRLVLGSPDHSGNLGRHASFLFVRTKKVCSVFKGARLLKVLNASGEFASFRLRSIGELDILCVRILGNRRILSR